MLEIVHTVFPGFSDTMYYMMYHQFNYSLPRAKGKKHCHIKYTYQLLDILISQALKCRDKTFILHNNSS